MTGTEPLNMDVRTTIELQAITSNGKIIINTKVNTVDITSFIYDTLEELVAEELIALGWTPPPPLLSPVDQ